MPVTAGGEGLATYVCHSDPTRAAGKGSCRHKGARGGGRSQEESRLLCEGSAPPPPPPRALSQGTPHPRMALPPPRGQTTPLALLRTLQNPAEGSQTRSPGWACALGAARMPAWDAGLGILSPDSAPPFEKETFTSQETKGRTRSKEPSGLHFRRPVARPQVCAQATNRLRKRTSRWWLHANEPLIAFCKQYLCKWHRALQAAQAPHSWLTCHHPPFISRTELGHLRRPPHTPRTPSGSPGRRPRVPVLTSARASPARKPPPSPLGCKPLAPRPEQSQQAGSGLGDMLCGQLTILVTGRGLPTVSERRKGPQAGRRRGKRENHYRRHIQLVSETSQKDVNCSRSRNVRKKEKGEECAPKLPKATSGH